MKFLLILLLVFTAFVAGFGQEKVISENEFTAVYDKWKLLSKEKSYRIKETFESYLNGNPSNHNEDSFSEYAPPDKKRFVSILKTPMFTTKIETIQIGEQKFTRKDEGEWKEVITKENAPPKRNRTISVENNSYKYLDRETINGQKTEVYEQVIKHKITNEKTSVESNSTIKNKYWFDENGLLLKTTTVAEIISGGMTSLSKRAYVYEYDPNIKIEAPVLKTETKPANLE